MSDNMTDQVVRARLRDTTINSTHDTRNGLAEDDAALLAAATAGLRMMPGDEHFSQLRDDSVSAVAT